MNLVDRLAKLLKKHDARLLVESRNEDHEIVLSLPARMNLDGSLMQYAVEYRLGRQFPQAAPQKVDLGESDSAA